MVVIEAVRLAVLLHKGIGREGNLALGALEALGVPLLAHGSQWLEVNKGDKVIKRT